MSASGEHIELQQLWSLSICIEIKSIPGFIAKVKTIAANMIAKNLIALQNYLALYSLQQMKF